MVSNRPLFKNKIKLIKCENTADSNLDDDEEMEENVKENNCLEFNNKDNFFENILEILEKFNDKFLHIICSIL